MLEAEGLKVPGEQVPASNSQPRMSVQSQGGGDSQDAAAAAKAEGNAKYKDGNYKDALVAWERALKLLPADDNERRFQIMGNLAAASLMLRRWKDCIKWCETVLEKDPQNYKIRARLATATVAGGDFAAARVVLGDGNDPALVAVRTQL